MNTDVARKLFDLNNEFYQNFAASFAQTRNRIQPGVGKILRKLPLEGNWLDIGCGNGSLVSEMIERGTSGTYCGLDVSPKLIQIAKEKVSAYGKDLNLKTLFEMNDLYSEMWISHLPKIEWDGIFMFSVMHHIPGYENRIALCRQILSLLKPNGSLFLSAWQINNSPRLMKRIRPWSLLEMDENEVEKGDVLLDWRAHHPDDAHEPALRYVHLLTEKELDDLASKCGFRITISFYSDGTEGNLGLYQIWQHDF